MATSASDGQQPALTTLKSLPHSVLGRCLLSAPEMEDRSAAFAACTSFTKAMLSTASETQVTLYADSFQPALATVLSWATECEAKLAVTIKDTAKPKYDRVPPASLQPLVRFLKQKGVRLLSVIKVHCESLLLDACTPGISLHWVFPNLEDLTLQDCRLDTSNLPLLPLTGCTKLQHLNLDPSGAKWPLNERDHGAWYLQLQQVASLPSLAAFSLSTLDLSTSFLPLWAGQLTALSLHYYQSYGDGEQAPWESAVTHASQCTNLRALKLCGCSTQDICSLVNSLPQLQELDLQRLNHATAEGSDFLLSALTSAPHLTRLSWWTLTAPVQSYADSPCTWQQLIMDEVTPQLLSKLPLHSLTQPLQFACFDLDRSTTVAEVQAAVANLARSPVPQVASLPSRHGGSYHKELYINWDMDGHYGDGAGGWVEEGGEDEGWAAAAGGAEEGGAPAAGEAEEAGVAAEGGAQANGAVAAGWEQGGGAVAAGEAGEGGAVAAFEAVRPAELLHAAGPLLPHDATSIFIDGCSLNAEVVTALQQGAPPTLTTLHVRSCKGRSTIAPSFWPQLARSFPQLPELKVDADHDSLSTMSVMSYYLAAALQQGPYTQGVPKVARITLSINYDVTGDWQRLREQLDALGFEGSFVIDTTWHGQ